MLNYFRGWKRKAGLVTLVMASAIAVLWLRSYSVDDSYSFGELALISFEGSLCLAKRVHRTVGLSAAADYDPVWITPYWLIVIPLTLLSAHLLLSKCRHPTKPEPSQQPAA